MANLGQLIIAVKTSGVAEARKQLEELDKLASSVGKRQADANNTGDGGGTGRRRQEIDEETQARIDAVKKREAEESAAMKRLQAQEISDIRQRSLLLKSAIEDRAKAETDANKRINSTDLADKIARIKSIQVDFGPKKSQGPSPFGQRDERPLSREFTIFDKGALDAYEKGAKRIRDGELKARAEINDLLVRGELKKEDIAKSNRNMETKFIELEDRKNEEIVNKRKSASIGDAQKGIFSNEFLRRSIGATIALKGVEIAADLAVAVGKGIEIGSVNGFARAAQNVPIIGGAFAAGRGIFEVVSGESHEKAIVEQIGITNNLRLRAKSYTEAQYQTAINGAQEEQRLSKEKLVFQLRDGEISEKNSKERIEAIDNETRARIQSIKFIRSQQLQELSNRNIAIENQVGVIESGGKGLHETAQASSTRNKFEEEYRSILLQVSEAKRRNDIETENALNRELSGLKKVRDAIIDAQHAEIERDNTIKEAGIVATERIARGTTAEETEQNILILRYISEHKARLVEINELHKISISAIGTEDEATAKLNEREAISRDTLAQKNEIRRLTLESFNRTQAQNTLQTEIDSTQKLIDRQSFQAQEIERHGALERHIAEEKRQGHFEEAELLSQLGIKQDAIASQRKNDTVSDIQEQTRLLQLRNSGRFNPLENQILQLREDNFKRKRAASSDEERKALDEEEKEQEHAAIRAGLNIKTVSSTQARLLAFRGRRGGLPESRTLPKPSDEGGGIYRLKQPTDGDGGIPLMKEGNKLLSQIVENTRNPVSRAA